MLEHARDARLVVTVEEGIAIGGFGSAVTDLLVDENGRAMPRISGSPCPTLSQEVWRAKRSLRDLRPDARQIAGHGAQTTLDRYKLVAL